MPKRDRAFYEKMHRHDPHRTPDQGWKEARRIVEEGRRVSGPRDGPEVITAARYLRAMAGCRGERGRDGIRRRNPDLHGALTVARTGGLAAAEIQARILAGQSDDEIAARCGVSAGAVGWYEKLFYETRGSLQAHDWIVIRAIGPVFPRADPVPDLGAVWRSSGYHAGPLALEAVLAVSKNEPFPPSIQPTSSPEDLRFAERLRKSTRFMLDATLLPLDVDPRFLFRLHLKLIAGRAPAREVRSIPELIDETLAGIPIRRDHGSPQHQTCAIGT